MGSTKSPLQEIPGIGPNLAEDLEDLGFSAPRDLRRQDPEKMYEDLCDLRQERIDPCVLYAFRCAVYYSRTKKPKPELLKWWNWKGRKL
jgi:hypothetical protein